MENVKGIFEGTRPIGEGITAIGLGALACSAIVACKATAVRNWFYVSGPAGAPILASQLANIHKCIAMENAELFDLYKILKILNTTFKQTSTITIPKQ
jgi:hypothetical protein